MSTSLRKNPFLLKPGFNIFLLLMTVLLLLPWFISQLLSSSHSGLFQIPVFKHGEVLRIVPQAPLEEPLFSGVEVKDFLVEALSETLTLSFDDYKTRMAEGKDKYFIDSGWQSFAKQLAKSRLYSTIFDNKEVIELIPSRVPFVLFSEPVSNDAGTYYMWRLTFYGAIYKKSFMDLGVRRKHATIEFEVDVQRVPRGNGSGAIKIVNVSNWRIKLMKVRR